MKQVRITVVKCAWHQDLAETADRVRKGAATRCDHNTQACLRIALTGTRG